MDNIRMSNPNITINTFSDGISTGTLRNEPYTPISSVKIVHDKRNGKDMVEVRVDGEVVFRYDPKSKGRIFNNIQEVERSE